LIVFVFAVAVASGRIYRRGLVEKGPLICSKFTFQNYATNPERMATALWKPGVDLGHIKAIQWGRDHEDDARKQYEIETKSKVAECGLFVSKENALFAASPDGVILSHQGLIEIKCPWSLKDFDLKTMTSVPSSQFFTCNSGKLSLKRNHTYFFQIQLGMFVTGYKFTDFVI
jgi:hypothetical protein